MSLDKLVRKALGPGDVAQRSGRPLFGTAMRLPCTDWLSKIRGILAKLPLSSCW